MPTITPKSISIEDTGGFRRQPLEPTFYSHASNTPLLSCATQILPDQSTLLPPLFGQYPKPYPLTLLKKNGLSFLRWNSAQSLVKTL